MRAGTTDRTGRTGRTGFMMTSSAEGGATMASPFDDPENAFVVLVNVAGEHSLWPVPLEVPAGWTVAASPPDGRRADCLDVIAEHWTAMSA